MVDLYCRKLVTTAVFSGKFLLSLDNTLLGSDTWGYTDRKDTVST
jgi:hypothetical protein